MLHSYSTTLTLTAQNPLYQKVRTLYAYDVKRKNTSAEVATTINCQEMSRTI